MALVAATPRSLAIDYARRASPDAALFLSRYAFQFISPNEFQQTPALLHDAATNCSSLLMTLKDVVMG